jgi:hypothetical protein
VSAQLRLRRSDNLIPRKVAVILCYSDVPDSTKKSKVIENFLYDQLLFDRRNIHVYRDLDLRNFEKLVESFEANEVKNVKPGDDLKAKVLFYFYFAAYWEFPGGNSILNMQTKEKINIQERLLDLAENERAIVISHRESDLRLKPDKDSDLADDGFQLARYTNS